MTRTVVLAIGLTVIVGISSPPVSVQSADQASLREQLDLAFKALSQGDIAFFDAHYVPEVSRFHLGGGPLDVGWNAEKAAAVNRSFARGWRVHTSSYNLADLRIYGDVAITAGTAIATHTTTTGETKSSNFRFTYVWTREGGKWKELHHHVSPYNAPGGD